MWSLLFLGGWNATLSQQGLDYTLGATEAP